MLGLKKTSFTTLIVGVFVAYVFHTCWVMYGIIYTKSCASHKTKGCIKPYLVENPRMQLSIYTSTKNSITDGSSLNLILNINHFDVNSKFERIVNISLPKKTRSNGTLFAHLFLHRVGVVPWHDSKHVYAVGHLTAYMIPKPEEINLITGETDGQPVVTNAETKVFDQPAAHWRSRLTINIMTDNFTFDGSALPADIHRYLRLCLKALHGIDYKVKLPGTLIGSGSIYGERKASQRFGSMTLHRKCKMLQHGKQVQYLPILFLDELSNRVRDLLTINSTSTTLPLTICYEAISLGKLRFWTHMQEAVFSLQRFGFTEKDVDEVKGIFVDTNLYFLALTFFVAAFHLLFDFLAFKNDISFWRGKNNMVGMSTKAVLWRCFSTIMIFLFLLDEQTSLLVLIPAGIGAIIEIWKVKKAFKMTIKWVGLKPTFQFGSFDESEKKTEEYDTQAMKYLSYVLYPLCFGGAVYSLLNVKYKSWYSWLINSLVNGVYAFGFLFMLPQLFVNYKLKSVAHLPWKAFMYKAFNTFIDDVFAFIITMPTSHRLACFRDDVVFLVYLYQRWLYPVDKSRINEFGESYDEKETERKLHKE